MGPSTSSHLLGRSGQFPAWPEIGGEDAAEYLEGATMARGASVLHSTGGGEGGIRTPVTVARELDFESSTFNHSDTSP